MELHPLVHEPGSTVAQMHKPKSKELMNEVDIKNAEDLLIIAVELYYEAKIFDWTVLTPVSFSIITMLEIGKKYYQGS